MLKILECLNNYDWSEVFGEGSGGNCRPIQPDYHPGYAGSTATFSREDVESVTKMVEGENDVSDWVVYGRLHDGRWFVARGGCDNTGWDCAASNSGNVAATCHDIERFGLSNAERERLGVVLDPAEHAAASHDAAAAAANRAEAAAVAAGAEASKLKGGL